MVDLHEPRRADGRRRPGRQARRRHMKTAIKAVHGQGRRAAQADGLLRGVSEAAHDDRQGHLHRRPDHAGRRHQHRRRRRLRLPQLLQRGALQGQPRRLHRADRQPGRPRPDLQASGLQSAQGGASTSACSRSPTISSCAPARASCRVCRSWPRCSIPRRSPRSEPPRSTGLAGHRAGRRPLRRVPARLARLRTGLAVAARSAALRVDGAGPGRSGQHDLLADPPAPRAARLSRRRFALGGRRDPAGPLPQPAHRPVRDRRLVGRRPGRHVRHRAASRRAAVDDDPGSRRRLRAPSRSSG